MDGIFVAGDFYRIISGAPAVDSSQARRVYLNVQSLLGRAERGRETRQHRRLSVNASGKSRRR